MARFSMRLLFATVPPVIGVALTDLPQSLSRLNLLVLQLLVQFYFNGRIAEQRRSRSTGHLEATPALFDRHLVRDLLVFAGSSIVALVSYVLQLQPLIAPG